MAFIGNTPTQQGFTPAIDYFSGNASTTAFTLSRPVASVAQVQAVIENVPQNPGDAFTVSGNTITFTSAPPSGTNNIYVYYTSPITTVIQPGQGTVGTTQVDGNFALWNKSGSNINYTAGNVLIGTASGGSARLAVDSGSTGLMTTFNSTNANGGYIALYSSSTVYGDIGTAAQVVSGGSASDFGINARGSKNLVLGTNNTERMRIDTAGRVTQPFQPCCRYTKSGNATYSTGVELLFDSNQLDVGGCYNTSTGRFTAPVAGTYMASFNVYAQNGSGLAGVAIRKNSAVPQSPLIQLTRSGDYQTMGTTVLFSLAAGDYVSVWRDAGNIYIDNNCSFSVSLIN